MSSVIVAARHYCARMIAAFEYSLRDYELWDWFKIEQVFSQNLVECCCYVSIVMARGFRHTGKHRPQASEVRRGRSHTRGTATACRQSGQQHSLADMHVLVDKTLFTHFTAATTDLTDSHHPADKDDRSRNPLYNTDNHCIDRSCYMLTRTNDSPHFTRTFTRTRAFTNPDRPR